MFEAHIAEIVSGLMASYSWLSFLENPWWVALFLLLFAVVLAKTLHFLSSQYFRVFASKTKTDIDDIIFEKSERPLLYLLLVFALQQAMLYLGATGTWLFIVDNLLVLVIVFIFSRVFDIALEIWGRNFAKKTKTELDEILLPLLHRFSKVIFVVIALMWSLDVWGIDITPYLAGVGLSGVVLGLALQDSLKNIFGGVSLILDGAIKVGDKIKLESGEVGKVIDVGLRSTKLVSFDNEMLTVPNGYLANSRVQNYAGPSSQIRVVIDFGVAYGTNVAAVKKLALGVISKMDDLMEEPAPDCIFHAMGDSAIEFKLIFWVDDWRNSYAKKLEATELLYLALMKKKIDIPYPTQTLHMVEE